ncbi:MAG TPA: metallophosphoesterase family protein [Gemmatimonadota bacterium]|nr:metallophosphoesterase family protein [Gemmatimonadota bacterium]
MRKGRTPGDADGSLAARDGAWRCALLADIHGNLPALEAVLADVQERGLDAAYHLGDLVGYAPWPDEVVARLAEAGIPGVAGNYDSTVATGAPHCGCRAETPEEEALAHESYAWTLAHVSAATRARLRALPFRIDLRPGGGHHSGPSLRLVHGAPTLNTLYWDASRSDDFARKMAEKLGAHEGDAVAFGHTHVPWKREIDGILFANAGSVGRPKDGDPRASWAIAAWDGGRFDVRHVRTEYDVERAAAAILESDLPGAFADDLRRGGPQARE